MKFSKQILAFFISTATTTSKGLSTEDIQKAVGDGCSNSFNFRSSFVTDNGSTCDTCVFCDGSRLSSLFDPKIENVCVDCGTVDNDCKNLEVATDFVTPWLMEFITLTSSAMGSENDPSGIVLKGSTDSNTWEMIYDSQLSFSNRKTDLEFVLNNSKQFKSYSMNFQRKNTSAKMYLGNYKIVQTYTKGCTAKMYGDITGEYVLPYTTLAPTEPPSISPTSKPTTPAGYEFTDNNSLKIAVELWTSNKSQAIETYGQIKHWNTGKITSMHGLFQNKHSFNDDLSLWDVSNVTSLRYLFNGCHSFNKDLSLWDTSNVSDMVGVFSYCKVFNSDISEWKTTNVTDMGGMFYDAYAININLSKWDVTKVTSMVNMFWVTYKFDQKLCWDVTGKEVGNMFHGSPGSIGCD